METHYQKKEIEKEYLKSESPLVYTKELTYEDKQHLFKEIYSNIAIFKKMIYDAKRED